MQTSLKTGFAKIFSCCPKKSELPKIWGGLQPPSPPRPVRLLVSLLKKCAKICVILNLDSLECFQGPLTYCPASDKGF